MKILSVMIPAFLAFSMVAVAEPWTLANITGRAFKNEVIRLPLKVPDGKVKVTEDGKTVPSVVDVFDGERAVFVRISIEPGQSKVYEVTTGEPGADRSDVTVKQDGDFIVLDNGRFSVKVPSKAAGDTPPAPVASIKTGDAWVGRGAWQTDMKFKKFSATVVDDGTVMGRVRLRYDFDGMAGLSGNIPAYAEVDVTLLPGRQYAVIEERHEMSRTSAWYFEPTVGWKAASRSICKPWGSSGFNGGRNKELAGTLKPLCGKTGEVRPVPAQLVAR